MRQKTVSIIYPYVPAMSNTVERWLKQRTVEGWRLVENNQWRFTFIKCAPYESEYFMYSGFGKSAGLSFDYHMVKMKYGKAKSKINKEHSPICEVDIIKIDMDYTTYKKLRNKYYIKHYLALSLYSLLNLICGWLVVLSYGAMLILVVLWFLIFLYAIISLIILKRDKGTVCVNPNEKN